MERIGKGAVATEVALERLLNSGTETGLVRSSTRSLSLPEVQAMAALMGQVKVNYGTQTLPDGWADRTRSHWTEIAAKHGISVLREAVEAHMDVSDFLPKKSEINRLTLLGCSRERGSGLVQGVRRHTLCRKGP